MIYLKYLLEVSTGLIAFYCIYHFLLHQEKNLQFNRFYLLSSIICAFLLPLIQIEGTIVVSDLNSSYNNQMDTFLESAIWTSPATTLSNFSISKILILGYWIGVSVGIFQLIRSVISILLLKKQSQIVPKKDYTLVYTSTPVAAFSFFNLLFWSEKANYTQEEKKLVFEHELVHIRQRHSLDIFIIELCKIFLWFNPILFLYREKLKEVHEFIADEQVILSKCTVLEYADLMMQEAKKYQQTLAIAHSFNHPIKNRLIMLTKTKNPQYALKALLSLPILLVLFFIFSTTENMTAQITTSASTELYPNHGYGELPTNAIPGNCYAQCVVKDKNDGKSLAWQEVLCPDRITSEVIKSIQKALGENGHPLTNPETEFGEASKISLTAYQKEKNLPIGSLNIHTIKALGITVKE